MSAVSSPAPGTDLGPCLGVCQHKRCIAMRRRAFEPCTVCSQPIGYATNYYADERMGEVIGYVHERCAEAVGS